jgi:predicted PurR-regulated permease PerM
MDKNTLKAIAPEPAAAEPVAPETAGAGETAETPEHAEPHHADMQTVALTILATLAIIFALQWARDFVVPLLIGVLIAYTLTPIMDRLERLKIPRLLGATLLTILLASGTVGGVNSLRAEFQSIIEQLPAATHKLTRAITSMRDGSPSTIQQMQAVASEIEKAANQAAGNTAAQPKAAAPAQPVFRMSELLVAGSMGIAGLLSQFAMVLFLVFFLLWSGDTFKRKLIKVVGSSLSTKKITLHILEEINVSVQRYMWMLLVTNSLLALMMWVALRWIGIENAGAWAVFSGLLHIVPYFGPLFITVATGLMAFLQFGTFSMMLLTAAVSLAIATFVGMFVTTWMAGRIAKMNAAAVFIGLLFWGWLWGIWGLLLGIPVIVILKVILERVEGLQSLGELLAE